MTFLLFRYSALTFNGHRIHYDRRYVTQIRGLPGPDRAWSADCHAAVDLLRRQPPGARVVAFDFQPCDRPSTCILSACTAKAAR